MRLTVKNLGVISKASVDLSKDLIILTGENNTGKTYLAYVIYGLSQVEYLPGANRLPQINSETPGKASIDLYQKFHEANYLESFNHRFLKGKLEEHIGKIFSVDDKFFSTEFNIDIEFHNKDFSKNAILELEINKEWITNGEFSNQVIKPKKSLVAEFTTENEDYLNMLVFHEMRRIALRMVIPNAVIIPAERTGINLFQKELSVLKNKAFDNLLSNGKAQEMFEFLETRFNKYPLPIKNALNIAQNLDAIQKKRSDFAFLADELEADFLQGNIHMSEDGDIRFTPNNSSKVLEIHMMSSSIKSLASLSIYLRHLAQKGDFIIIDEPEANLHPNNQLKIARFLARLVNEGFKVMISTHSDYIMREINSLIMLGALEKNEPEKANSLLKKFKEYGKNQFLDKNQVGVYLFRQGKDVEELKVEDTGFEIQTIDETVDRLNETSQNIYYELFD